MGDEEQHLSPVSPAAFREEDDEEDEVSGDDAGDKKRAKRLSSGAAHPVFTTTANANGDKNIIATMDPTLVAMLQRIEANGQSTMHTMSRVSAQLGVVEAS